MSASQDKRKRQTERAEGTEKRQLKAEKQKEKWSKTKRNYTIGGITIGVFAAVIIILSSNLFYSGTNAVHIGDQKYSAAELNYYYYTNYYNFLNAYGDSAGYFFDSSVSLKKQQYFTDEYETWDDYFKSLAISTMTGITALYEEALANGHTTASQEKMDEINSNLAGLKESAASYGYSSVKQYLGAMYGKGCSEKLLRNLMIEYAIATEYSQSIYDSYVYTHEEIEDFYSENRDDFDTITYSSAYVSGAIPEHEHEEGEEHDEETEVAAAMKEAKELADTLASLVDDVESFSAAALALLETEISNSISMGSEIATDYGIADWLLADSRKSGDVTVIEEASGYYVLLFSDRDDNNYNVVAARHILTKIEADENGEYTDEARAAALQEAEDLLAQWKSGEATEESFGRLADEHSDDAGSNTNGGLYENIYKRAMVEEFDAFCFGPRKPGDTAVVYGETEEYAGYHVVYFVGEGDKYSDILAERQMRSDAYAEWETETLEGYEAVTKFSIWFAGK